MKPITNNNLNSRYVCSWCMHISCISSQYKHLLQLISQNFYCRLFLTNSESLQLIADH